MLMTTWSGATPTPDGKAMLEHVITVVLKQVMDGLLAKAMDTATVHKINDVHLFSKPARDALTFYLNDGTEKRLPIGYRNLLRVLKIFTDHSQANGHPIGDWTTIAKKDFDDFRCSQVCMAATEKIETLSSPTLTSDSCLCSSSCKAERSPC